MKVLTNTLEKPAEERLTVGSGVVIGSQQRSGIIKHSDPLIQVMKFLVLLFIVLGCSFAQSQSDESENQMPIVNPYSNYEFLLETVTKNRDAIIHGSRLVNMLDKPYCIARIDSLIDGGMTPVEPSYRARSEKDLADFLKKEYRCSNFAHDPIDIEAGNHSFQFFQEAPFLVYQFRHQGQDYFSLLGSGGYKHKGHPRTPEVDYEPDTFPYFSIYSGKGCKSKGWTTVVGPRHERGISAFSGFLLGQDGTVYSYKLSIFRHGEFNRASVAVNPLFWSEENYCASGFELLAKENNQ